MYLCRNFVIQGGDPTSTGKGGESIWGKPFKDKVNSKLLHSGRVFGGVVGGLTALAVMEKVPVDDNDRPLVGSLFRINLSKTTYILNLYLIFTTFCFTIKWYSLTDDRCKRVFSI
ncbi:hypothetical protein Pint_10764 [Pistacia integerrima]|uniref:Uncharacterized protein n=1 Tax=Pistacia integerrima TaxID=434235 RepID=A0ACC0XDN5_9ROSI|nr:hypothetical protein Pint_10764 [Pistacia integerrima]